MLLLGAGLSNMLQDDNVTWTLFAPRTDAWTRTLEDGDLTCTKDSYHDSACATPDQLLKATNLRQILLNHSTMSQGALSSILCMLYFDIRLIIPLLMQFLSPIMVWFKNPIEQGAGHWQRRGTEEKKLLSDTGRGLRVSGASPSEL